MAHWDSAPTDPDNNLELSSTTDTNSDYPRKYEQELNVTW